MSTLTTKVQPGLRWQCRRGMLELDILLNTFLDNAYHQLSSNEQKQFKILLDYPDQTLFDLLMKNMRSSDALIDKLVGKINHNMASDHPG